MGKYIILMLRKISIMIQISRDVHSNDVIYIEATTTTITVVK